MEICEREGRHIFVCKYEERQFPKQAGFHWDPERREWYTTDPEVARAGRGLLADGIPALAPDLFCEKGEWVYRSLPEDRQVAKAAGMIFDKETKTWRTTSVVVALAVARALEQHYTNLGWQIRSSRYAQLVAKLQDQRDEALSFSTAATGNIDVPAPAGLSYLPYQLAGVAFALEHERCVIGDEMGLGKAQPIDEPVLTPEGWKKIGSLVPGDKVLAVDGTPTSVIGVFPQGLQPIRRVSTNDGGWTRVTPEHLFEVERDGVTKVCTTLEIERDLRRGEWWTLPPTPLFPLPRSRFVTRIEEEGEAEAVCIRVDHPRELYVTRNHIVTHNTIQAIGLLNLDPKIREILVVAPLAVSLNWAQEIEKWSLEERVVGRATATSWPDAEVVIIHPQILIRHEAHLRERAWDLVVIDEAHLFKSGRAKRTKALFGGVRAKRALALTGTPIPNKPIELWALLHWLRPDEFKSRNHYSTRYCGGHYGRFGWEEGGAAHLDELRERLRATVLIRRLKRDVLPDLPPKRRQIIALDPSATTEIRNALLQEQEIVEVCERDLVAARVAVELAKASSDPEEYKKAVANLRSVQGVGFSQMSKSRHDLAVSKVPLVAEHAAQVLDGGVEKLVLWAHHHDVINGLRDALSQYGVVVVTGETSSEDRALAVDEFQGGKARVFLGSVTAAGVGITLTAASLVIFAELDWVPATVTQAEDRCHRIGQADSVLVQHIVVDGSLDARMAQMLVRKQAIADRALDVGKKVEDVEEVEVLPVSELATREVKPDRLAPLAARVNDEIRNAVHEGLRIVASLDWDQARLENEVGFSRVDVGLGHSLAETERLTDRQAALGAFLVRRYRKQLPAELVAKVGRVFDASGEAL